MSKKTWTESERTLRQQRWDEKRAARIEDIEFLLKWDGNAESISKRAGFTCTASAERQLARWGRHDLAAKLHAVAADVDPWESSRRVAL